jgi:hypothetical protein
MARATNPEIIDQPVAHRFGTAISADFLILCLDEIPFPVEDILQYPCQHFFKSLQHLSIQFLLATYDGWYHVLRRIAEREIPDVMLPL